MIFWTLYRFHLKTAIYRPTWFSDGLVGTSRVQFTSNVWYFDVRTYIKKLKLAFLGPTPEPALFILQYSRFLRVLTFSHAIITPDEYITEVISKLTTLLCLLLYSSEKRD